MKLKIRSKIKALKNIRKYIEKKSFWLTVGIGCILIPINLSLIKKYINPIFSKKVVVNMFVGKPKNYVDYYSYLVGIMSILATPLVKGTNEYESSKIISATVVKNKITELFLFFSSFISIVFYLINQVLEKELIADLLIVSFSIFVFSIVNYIINVFKMINNWIAPKGTSSIDIRKLTIFTATISTIFTSIMTLLLNKLLNIR